MCSDDADPPHIELAPDRLVRISTASYLEMRQSIARLTAERDAWSAAAERCQTLPQGGRLTPRRRG